MTGETMPNRSKKTLSDYYVDRLKPGTRDRKFWDADIPGFGFRITAGNYRSWVVQFSRGGNKVSATLGTRQEMNTDTARARAKDLRDLHRKGVDILAHLHTQNTAPTVEKVIEAWSEDGARHLKPSTVKSYKSIIKTCILPRLGKRLIKDLNLDDVKTFHKALAKTPTQANRAVAVLSALITLAIDAGWREFANPCRRFTRPSEKPKKRTFSIGELEQLEKTLQSLVKAKRLDETIADLVRFIALSGLRSGEALALTWDAVDMSWNIMRFHDHKTDKGGTQPKMLPLNTHLGAILVRRRAKKTGDFVFPSPVTNGLFKGMGKCWGRIRKQAAFVSKDGESLTLHDLRRTFRSQVAELGFDDSVGETLLGHSLGKVKDTYIRYTPGGRIGTASQVTADWIFLAMQGKKPKVGERAKPSGSRG